MNLNLKLYARKRTGKLDAWNTKKKRRSEKLAFPLPKAVKETRRGFVRRTLTVLNPNARTLSDRHKLYPLHLFCSLVFCWTVSRIKCYSVLIIAWSIWAVAKSRAQVGVIYGSMQADSDLPPTNGRSTTILLPSHLPPISLITSLFHRASHMLLFPSWLSQSFLLVICTKRVYTFTSPSASHSRRECEINHMYERKKKETR
jgi:hypothetical protein